MDDQLEFLEKNKAIIKKAWLEYYAKNSAFLDKIVENWYTRVNTPDGGHRVKGEWILGILAGKYSNFTKMLYTIYLGTDNVEKIIDILELNFDPNKELEKVKNDPNYWKEDKSKDDSNNKSSSPFPDIQEGINNFQGEINKLFKGFDLNL